MSFNKVFIMGNVGRMPEVRHLEGGNVVAEFSVATTEYYKDRNGSPVERTDWHNITVWGKSAEFVERFVETGTQVFVEGKIRYREYTDKNGQKRSTTEITADNIQLTGKKKSDDLPK